VKKLMIATLVSAQLGCVASPAMAAELGSAQDQRPGAFGGLRLRLPLDGPRRNQRLRAGLTLAPTLRIQDADGASRLRFGEGLEFGISGREPARLSLGGVPVNQLARGPAGPDGRRMGVSTLGWIGIGVGAAVIIVVGAAALCVSDHDCLPSE